MTIQRLSDVHSSSWRLPFEYFFHPYSPRYIQENQVFITINGRIMNIITLKSKSLIGMLVVFYNGMNKWMYAIVIAQDSHETQREEKDMSFLVAKWHKIFPTKI